MVEGRMKVSPSAIKNASQVAAAILGYQATIDATKSPQREAAAEYKRFATERERRGI